MGQAEGYAFVIISVLFFGSNFVVTKKYKTGDGFYFQWVMCSAILVAGLMDDGLVPDFPAADSCPPFEPFAMLGGMIWCFGNVTVVPIVKCIGLGLGLCIWGSSNMLIGWASGNFGILGVTATPVAHPNMNYAGVALAVVSMIIFFFIKSEGGNVKKSYHKVADVEDPGLNIYGANAGLLASSLNAEHADEEEEESWTDKLTPAMKKIVGLCGALVAGCLYGTNFNPPSYAKGNYKYPNHSAQMANLYSYVLPHFCGIFVTSTVFLIAYCIVKRNTPKVYPQVTFPAILSGFIWSIAQIGFFYANANLGMTVSFPMITVGPGLVGALWGTFAFREITGTRNYILLAAAFAFGIASAVTIALSNQP